MKTKKVCLFILTLWICFVFIQSLLFKFSNSLETQHIFNTLNDWAADTFDINTLFIVPGIFNAYVIGAIELLASILLLVGLFARYKVLLPIGSFLAFCIISGAISFHLFTPLGIVVHNDGGTLFIMACSVWISSIIVFLASCANKG